MRAIARLLVHYACCVPLPTVWQEHVAHVEVSRCWWGVTTKDVWGSLYGLLILSPSLLAQFSWIIHLGPFISSWENDSNWNQYDRTRFYNMIPWTAYLTKPSNNKHGLNFQLVCFYSIWTPPVHPLNQFIVPTKLQWVCLSPLSYLCVLITISSKPPFLLPAWW